jgi:hypothetical protein
MNSEPVKNAELIAIIEEKHFPVKNIAGKGRRSRK